MAAFSYYATLPFLYLLSVLPLRVLYVLSDVFVFPLLYHLIKYRRNVVRKNLRASFPEKSEEELKTIEVKFYHHLADLFLETIKLFTISKDSLAQRVDCDPDGVLKGMFDKNQSMVMSVGHFGNYEWGSAALPSATRHEVYVPYKKVQNPYFDQLFKKSRGVLSVHLFHAHRTQAALYKIDRQQPFILGLANDQSAPPKTAFWTKFLNQDTSFFAGTEKISREMELAVVYARILKVARGHFRMEYELITENANLEPAEFIMKRHVELLEADIRSQPEFWLWTHKRWKHEMPEGYSYGFNKVVRKRP